MEGKIAIWSELNNDRAEQQKLHSFPIVRYYLECTPLELRMDCHSTHICIPRLVAVNSLSSKIITLIQCISTPPTMSDRLTDDRRLHTLILRSTFLVYIWS